ncbi:tensin-1-like [Wyeomyia smithii]|uniref:tensin-1-like n=1 Tax=Wyeomyia smithii TaxID=174621 RepID=UPI002467E0F9|nr:tensin-1-like [Wyeomyia smithii]
MGSVSHQKISTRLIIFLMLAAGTGLSRFGAVHAIAVETTDAMLESTQTTVPVDVPETEADEPTSAVSEKSDLSEAETKDPKKLEIIKQIRKINNDGSYTVGYEAEDGTFKIESRDVLGNIKGTYGYIDENGDIQRVSYNAHNSTGIKGTAPAPVTEDVVHIPPKFNRSHIGAPTTRRPASYHTSSTIAPQRTSVIQTIPRKRPHVTSTTERPTSRVTETSASYSEPTMASSQSSSVQTPKPLLIIRPTPLPLMAKTIEQLARPEKLESEHITKIYSKSVTPRQREPERKPLRGNFLRRQLPPDSSEQYEAQQQVVYGQSAGEEIANLFAATPPGLRPIYTTTPAPRIPAAVLAARQRAAQLQSLLSSERPETTTERVYAKPPRKQEPAPVMYEPATEPSSENSYVTDTPGSVVQIPANSNREVTETAEDERRVYRQRPIEFRPREAYRFAPAQDRPERYRVPLGIPPHGRTFPSAEPSYYRDASGRSPENYPSEDEDNNIAYRQQRRPQGPPPPPPGYIQNQQESPVANSVPNAHSYPQQSYPVPYAYNPYRNPYQTPVSPYYDVPDRPLTTRDFERILQLLIFRHQQAQHLQAYRFGGYTNPYYGGPSLAPPFIPGSYPGAPGGGYPAQIPRPPFFNPGAGYFDPRYQNPLYSPSTGTRQYTPAGPNGGPQQTTAADYSAPEQQAYQLRRRQPQQQPHVPQYAPRIDHDYQGSAAASQQELIPPEVREDLLYRMLLLAIQHDPAAPFHGGGGGVGGEVPGAGYVPAGSVPRPQTTSPSPGYSKKPVRSVQILGEE